MLFNHTLHQLHLIVAPSSWKKICHWSTQLNFNILIIAHPKVKQQLRLLRKTIRNGTHEPVSLEGPVTHRSSLQTSHTSLQSSAIHLLLRMQEVFLGWTLPILAGSTALLLQLLAFPSPLEDVSHWSCDTACVWQCWAALLLHSLTLE